MKQKFDMCKFDLAENFRSNELWIVVRHPDCKDPKTQIGFLDNYTICRMDKNFNDSDYVVDKLTVPIESVRLVKTKYEPNTIVTYAALKNHSYYMTDFDPEKYVMINHDEGIVFTPGILERLKFKGDDYLILYTEHHLPNIFDLDSVKEFSEFTLTNSWTQGQK